MGLIVLHRNAFLIQRFIRVLALAVEPRPKGRVPKSTFCLNNHNKIKCYVYIFIHTIRWWPIINQLQRSKHAFSLASNLPRDCMRVSKQQNRARFRGTPNIILTMSNTETALSEAALSGVLQDMQRPSTSLYFLSF